MKFRNLLALSAALVAAGATASDRHPLDGLTGEEISRASAILRETGHADADTLYPLIELLEPDKKAVINNESTQRKAVVHYTGKEGFHKAIVNLDSGEVEESAVAKGQPMVLFTEFLGAADLVLSSPEFLSALEKRGLTADDVYCLPLTAGNFLEPGKAGERIMKVPCYQLPSGSNFYAKPIENLFAEVDLVSKEILRVVDEGALPKPQDAWGYTEEEVALRTDLRPKMNPAKLTQTGEPNYTIDGSLITWDIWRMRYRVDKRPGIVLSQIEVNDSDEWRSVLYQTHLSEVFVPYQDPSEGWYWRTYMDSGEYGFGLFLSPLRAGLDCPTYATFLPAIVNDDGGAPIEIPDAICIFERDVGDPAWRHFEIFAQDFENEVFVPTEGRPATELVVRTASQVGNYDYFIDYRFKQNGDIYIKIGATGLDGVKGTKLTSMRQAGAKDATKHGVLIAPHLIAPMHSHYFNFKLDFDIDKPANTAMRMDIVGTKAPAGTPRKSLWELKRTIIASEQQGTFSLSSQRPAHLMLMNTSRKNYLGHPAGWMVHHLSVGAAPFDFVNDLPMRRNAYIKHQLWNTRYNPDERYAGGEYAFASDGSDTLETWIDRDRNLRNKDIVTWATAGFHHIPRTEDWPVMPTEWRTIHIMPMNFFPHNPALNIRDIE